MEVHCVRAPQGVGYQLENRGLTSPWFWKYIEFKKRTHKNTVRNENTKMNAWKVCYGANKWFMKMHTQACGKKH